MNHIIIAFIIYVYSFIKLGNTVYRLDSNNNIQTNYLVLFNEGFIGPLRSFIYSVLYNNSGLEYLYSQLFQWHNPYWTFGFFYLLNLIIKFISKNLKKNYK